MQDEGLDVISEGLDTLKNIALDMNEVYYYTYYFGLAIIFGAIGD